MSSDIPTIANQLALAMKKISELQDENLALKQKVMELKMANQQQQVQKRAKRSQPSHPSSSTSSSDDDTIPTTTTNSTSTGGGKFSPHKDKDGSIHFALEKNKRVSISQFKKKIFVGVREWYEKGGKMLPGKGISLSVEAWKELCEQMEAAQKAHDDGNTEFSATLAKTRTGGEKKLSISEFRNNLYYNIREYFVGKDGQLLPTKKGTSLDEATWTSLTELVASVEAAIDEIANS
eukprot:m.20394 g.20394  ORF g.20394 m.20394 type:complete len:235 (-) comp8566_c0_seq2:20-724(-)